MATNLHQNACVVLRHNKAMHTFMDRVSMASSDGKSELDSRKLIKYGSVTQAAWGIISEYFNYSTIHGLRYLAEKRPILEKFFWAAIFLFSIYACARLTHNIWVKWNEDPVIVSFAEKPTPVWQIPFPAVTICPQTAARPSIFNYTETYWMLRDGKINETTEEQMFYMEAMSQACDLYLLEELSFGSPVVNNTLYEALETAAVEFDFLFEMCDLKNYDGTCRSMFRKIITEEGLCYTFNSIGPTEIYRNESIHDKHMLDLEFDKKSAWNPEDGYASDAGMKTYPHRVLGAGARAGLTVLVNGMPSYYDYMCKGPVQGVKVILTTPGEFPRVAEDYLRVKFGQEVLISIKPNSITTSDGLKDYTPDRRQCYFQKERYLRYFQLYTQSNCEIECLANYTLRKCGCVKYSLPRNASTPICGAANIECYDDGEDEVLYLQSSMSNSNDETKCNCLPACMSIIYKAEISPTKSDYQKKLQAFRRTVDENKYPGLEASLISLYIKDNQFIGLKRSELYGTTDFLASSGGLLGLFLGVSTFSLIELVYFCTVRLILNLRMRHKKRKQLAKIQMVQPCPWRY